MKAFASILLGAVLLTGCGESSKDTQENSSDNDTSKSCRDLHILAKRGQLKTALTFVWKDDKTFTAEESSDKFSGT